MSNACGMLDVGRLYELRTKFSTIHNSTSGAKKRKNTASKPKFIIQIQRFLFIPITSFYAASFIPLTNLLIVILKLTRELVQSIQGEPEVLVSDLLSLAQSQRMRCPRRILDLAPIDAAFSEVCDLRVRDARGRGPHLLDEGFPNFLLRGLGKVAEVECDVDTR